MLINARLQAIGGTETHLLHLCRALASRGVEVVVASRYAVAGLPLVEECAGWRMSSTPFAGTLKWFRLSTLWACAVWPLRLGRFDVVYTLEASAFTRVLASMLKPGGRILWNRVGEPPSGAVPLSDAARTRIDGVIAETRGQVDAVRRCFDLPVPGAALPHLFHGGASDVAPRTTPRTDLHVAYLGRLVAGKGIFRLLDCWRAIDVGPARLTFYGDGPDRAALLERVGLDGDVAVAAGWRDGSELAAILSGVDLLVLPSEHEGVPLILLEAMAHGVPWIATDVGAIASLANPDARVVPLDDQALRQAVIEMAASIRSGAICPARLQAHARGRYDIRQLTEAWCGVLLQEPARWPADVRV